MTNNAIEDYVLALSDDEKILIINGWEHLQKVGSIGDDPIRTHAHTLMTQLNFSETDAHIVMWMSQLAMESYRYFIWKAFKRFPMDEFDWSVGLDKTTKT
jgi:hypothetical protein